MALDIKAKLKERDPGTVNKRRKKLILLLVIAAIAAGVSFALNAFFNVEGSRSIKVSAT